MNAQISQTAAPFRWVRPIAVFASIFGVLTVFSGGSVLFGPADAQEWAGNYMHFVVWFNFLAGGVYIVAAIGFWRHEGWAVQLSGIIATATAIVILGFGVMVLRGSAFEIRTVGALAFRFLFWTAIALMARRRTIKA